MNEGVFLDECLYWTDWSCGLYVSVFSVIAIVTHFCEAISAIWSFYFESWNHYLNLYFLFTPKCFGSGNGATRKGAKQFEPSHSTNGFDNDNSLYVRNNFSRAINRANCSNVPFFLRAKRLLSVLFMASRVVVLSRFFKITT